MNIVASIDRNQSGRQAVRAGIVRGRDPASLAAIRRHNVNLAVLDRAPPDFVIGLERLDHGALPEGVVTVPHAADRALLGEMLPVLSMPVFAALADDVVWLLSLFGTVVGARAARLRLQPLSHDGCRYFHTDRVGVRLITTYFGPGTDYVPDDAIRRECLGQGDNRAVVPDETAIHRLGPGAIGLFKGDLGFGGARVGGGIVHRSPPVAETGDRRFLVVIDEASAIGV